MGLYQHSLVLVLAVAVWTSRQQEIHGFPMATTITSYTKKQRRQYAVSSNDHGLASRPHTHSIRNFERLSTSSTSALQMARWKGTEDVDGTDVLKSCIPYLLPLLDGELFGKYIYQQVPPLGFLDSLFIGPLAEFFNRVPFLSLILFVALTLGTRMNTDMNWNVRFNAQQAALIDVVLVFPELIGSAFENEELPRYIEAPCMNFVWYTYMAMVLYSIYSNVVLRKRPDQIPYISAYATTMTGPI